MSFQLIWDLKVQGAQQARYELEKTAEAFKKGEASAAELDAAIKKYDKAAAETLRTQRTLNNEWKITHPSMAQVAVGLDKMSAAAQRFNSIYQTLTLVAIRNNTTARKEGEILSQLMILRRRKADMEKSPDFNAGSKEYLELNQQIMALENDLQENKSNALSDFVDTAIQAGIIVPTAARGIKDIADGLNALKKIDALSVLATGWTKVASSIKAVISLQTLASISQTAGLAGGVASVGILAGAAYRANQNHVSFEDQLTSEVNDLASGKLVPDTSPLLKGLGKVSPSSGNTQEATLWDVMTSGWQSATQAVNDFISAVNRASTVPNAYGQTPVYNGGGGQSRGAGAGDTPTTPTVTTNPNGSTTINNHNGIVTTVTPAKLKEPKTMDEINTFTYKGFTGATAVAAARANNMFASGGVLMEPVVGVGTRTGESYLMGEVPERLTPMSGGGGAGSTVVNNIYNITVQGSVIRESELAQVVARHMKIDYNRSR